jgi:hypothetical protein
VSSENRNWAPSAAHLVGPSGGFHKDQMKFITRVKLLATASIAVLVFAEIGISWSTGLLLRFDQQTSFLMVILGCFTYALQAFVLEKNPGVIRGVLSKADKFGIGKACLIASVNITAILVISERLA